MTRIRAKCFLIFFQLQTSPRKLIWNPVVFSALSCLPTGSYNFNNVRIYVRKQRSFPRTKNSVLTQKGWGLQPCKEINHTTEICDNIGKKKSQDCVFCGSQQQQQLLYDYYIKCKTLRHILAFSASSSVGVVYGLSSHLSKAFFLPFFPQVVSVLLTTIVLLHTLNYGT